MYILCIVHKHIGEMPVGTFAARNDALAFVAEYPVGPHFVPAGLVVRAISRLRIPYDWDKHKRGEPGWDTLGYKLYETDENGLVLSVAFTNVKAKA